MATPLTTEELNHSLTDLPAWTADASTGIHRTWTFENFAQAMGFVDEVAVVAEDAGHHPDIDIRYNKVKLALITHDAGGITIADIEMAGRIDKRFLRNTA